MLYNIAKCLLHVIKRTKFALVILKTIFLP